MVERVQPSAARIALLEWVARLGVVTAEALATRRGVELGTATSQLAAAEHAGLLLRRRVLTGRPALYTPTSAGMRAVAEPASAPCRVNPANARHLIACAAVAAMLERLYPEHRVQGERRLRRDERVAGRQLASTRLPRPGRVEASHHPDLAVWPPPATGLGPVAVEVELTVKGAPHLTEICEAWAASRCVAGVLYVVAPEVERPLTRAIGAVAGQRRIAVVRLDAFIAHSTGRRIQRTVSSAP